MAKVMIISDIHGNFEALKAIDSQIDDSIDYIWNLGDTVGYGPQPNECVEWVRENCDISLAGNHDVSVLDPKVREHMNGYAYVANSWTEKNLTEENKQYLSSLQPIYEMTSVVLAHASIQSPLFVYIDTKIAAKNAAGHMKKPLLFVGHTHKGGAYCIDDKENVLFFKDINKSFSLNLGDNKKYIINPGSVGQPRDGIPLSAYAILDTEEGVVVFHRIKYDVRKVQEEFALYSRFLAPVLSQRLSAGR